MLFLLQNSRSVLPEILELYDEVNTINIQVVSTFKLLGVKLDNKLTFTKHWLKPTQTLTYVSFMLILC